MHDIWFASKIVALLKEKESQGVKPEHIIVNVALSPFTHVTKESLLGAFKMLSAKEKFNDVVINIKTNEVTIKCKKCGLSTKITKPTTACPECGGADFEIENAEEFIIQSIEIKEA